MGNGEWGMGNGEWVDSISSPAPPAPPAPPASPAPPTSPASGAPYQKNRDWETQPLQIFFKLLVNLPNIPELELYDGAGGSGLGFPVDAPVHD